MSNNIAPALKRAVILKSAMAAFKHRLVSLGLFSTVFRDIPLEGSNDIEVPYYPLETAASKDYNGTYQFDDGDLQSKKVTVNRRKYQSLTYSSEEKANILKYSVRKMTLSVKSRKGFKRDCLLVIEPKNESASPITIEFNVDNSRGRGIWEVFSPFHLSSASYKVPSKSRKIKQHFLHNIVKLKKRMDDENLTIRQLSELTNLKRGMLGRQLKMFENLSLDAAKFILRLRYKIHTDLLSFRKLEAISEKPKARQLNIIKKLLNKA